MDRLPQVRAGNHREPDGAGDARCERAVNYDDSSDNDHDRHHEQHVEHHDDDASFPAVGESGCSSWVTYRVT